MRGTSHFVRSISITIGSTCAGRDRTDVEKMSRLSDESLGELLEKRCDVVLVDLDGLPH